MDFHGCEQESVLVIVIKGREPQDVLLRGRNLGGGVLFYVGLDKDQTQKFDCSVRDSWALGDHDCHVSKQSAAALASQNAHLMGYLDLDEIGCFEEGVSCARGGDSCPGQCCSEPARSCQVVSTIVFHVAIWEAHVHGSMDPCIHGNHWHVDSGTVWRCTVHPPNLHVLVTSCVTSHYLLLVSLKSLCAHCFLSSQSGLPKWVDWSLTILLVHHSALYIYLTNLKHHA